MNEASPNMAQSGRQIAEVIWPYYSELIRMGADVEDALNLTFLLMKAIMQISK